MKASISEWSLVDLRAFLPPSRLADEFDVTIKAKRRKPDVRRRVKDPAGLKAFVDAVVACEVAPLPPKQQAFADAVRRRLLVKPTVNSVIEAIAAYRGTIEHDWEDIKKGALKDNYYRPSKVGPRGQAPRTRRARQAALRQGI